METQKKIFQAATLAVRLERQNNAINEVVRNLKEITHNQIATIPCTALENELQYHGISEDDIIIINDFMKFLKKREITNVGTVVTRIIK
jgi:hypothetical protein